MKTNAKFIYSVLAGAAVGAIYGFLFTTTKGSDLRHDLTDSARRFGSDIKDKAIDSLDMIAEKTSDVRGSFRSRVDDISDDIKGGFDKVKSKGRRYAEKTVRNS